LMTEIYAPLTEGTYALCPSAIPQPNGTRTPARLLTTSTRSAELIKHASNAFLAMKISFINAVATVCESAGADISEVREGIGADSRIGEKFLSPGIGYGGSCFPKDAKAFSAVARECGYRFRLLEEVMLINEEQRARFMRKVRLALWTLKGKRLAVLGLAFKGGTDDIRESPAIAFVKQLLREECQVVVYDPAAMDKVRSSEPLAKQVLFAESPYEAAKDADALLILTDWEQFGSLDLQRLKTTMRYPIIVDGRNLYSPSTMAAAGFNYVSVGRPDVLSARREVTNAAAATAGSGRVSHRGVRISFNPAVSGSRHQHSIQSRSE
jgi:UDPglucose 6-dehydrogenase